jgi:CRISPR-associated endonuclease Cas1
MAASKNITQLSQSNNSLIPRHGILVLRGYGIQIRVDRGHLLVEDGIGRERHQSRFPRVGHGLERLIVIGATGSVTLAALRWLADQDAALILIERDGRLLCNTGPVRSSDARLRRAQALAHQSGAAFRIALELISQKLAGQERVAREKLHNTTSADEIAECRLMLAEAEDIDSIRSLESRGAATYWAGWRDLPIKFPKNDLPRVPEHWRTFGTRKSLLSGSPRLATNPANAMLNYVYAVAESETRLAVSALGLDSGLGFLHVDTPARDSLSCDVIEPIRAQVDAFVLDWLTSSPLRRESFFEERNGNCRLMAPLAARLSETAPTWRRAVAPFAEWVAQTLWSSIRKPGRQDHVLATPLTQRRRSEGRGKDFVPNVEPPPVPERICHGCGVTTQRGRHCPKCGREISKEKLIELAKLGRVAAQNPESRKRHSETQRRHEAAKRAWRSSTKPLWLTEQTYVERIQPRLAMVTISALSSALGVSESYAADIRKGRHRPHPRHWQALAALVGY